jgi:hypothetical protein
MLTATQAPILTPLAEAPRGSVIVGITLPSIQRRHWKVRALFIDGTGEIPRPVELRQRFCPEYPFLNGGYEVPADFGGQALEMLAARLGEILHGDPEHFEPMLVQ